MKTLPIALFLFLTTYCDTSALAPPPVGKSFDIQQWLSVQSQPQLKQSVEKLASNLRELFTQLLPIPMPKVGDFIPDLNIWENYWLEFSGGNLTGLHTLKIIGTPSMRHENKRTVVNTTLKFYHMEADLRCSIGEYIYKVSMNITELKVDIEAVACKHQPNNKDCKTGIVAAHVQQFNSKATISNIGIIANLLPDGILNNDNIKTHMTKGIEEAIKVGGTAAMGLIEDGSDVSKEAKDLIGLVSTHTLKEIVQM